MDSLIQWHATASRWERRTNALLLNVSVAVLSWIRQHYMLNKRIFPLRSFSRQSFLMLLVSGITWWISIDAIDSNAALQVCAGLIATVFTWFAKCIIVNERYFPITPVQYAALPFQFFTEVLRQMQIWLLVDAASRDTEHC